MLLDITAVHRAVTTKNFKVKFSNFMPQSGKILFHRLWKELLEVRCEPENALLPLIDAQREKRHKKRKHFVLCCTLTDFQFPHGGRKYSDEELVSLCSSFFMAGQTIQ